MLITFANILILFLGVTIFVLLLLISGQHQIIEKYKGKVCHGIRNLESGTQRKAEFISIASHQLRSPLSSITGHISMILDGDFGDVPENLKLPLERVSKSSSSLGVLINDFINISKIEKNELTYSMTNFNLNEVLKIIYHDFELAAKEKKLLLTNLVPENERVMVTGDFNKTKQIISNVVENAIKYTPEGKVEIHLEKSKNFVTVMVSDTGIGVREDQKSEIFGKFIRDEDAARMDVEGTGIGLYIALVMISALGGKIWVESEGVGKGSTFYLKFPLAK